METNEKAERRMLFGLDENNGLWVKRNGTYETAKNVSKGSVLLVSRVEEAKNLRTDLELRHEGNVVPVTVSKRSHYVYVAMHKPKANRKMVRTSKLEDSAYDALAEEWNVETDAPSYSVMGPL